MPVETQRIKSYTTTDYQCSFCDYQSSIWQTCAEHEWEEHQKSKTSVRYESAWGDEFKFRHFPDLETFNSFAAAYCARTQKWEDSGWYKEFTYQWSRMGCDMGDTVGLEKMDDRDCAAWIDDGMRQRAAALPVRFGISMNCPTLFESNGVAFRRRSHRVPDESISIDYACPDNVDPPDGDALVEAWKVWREDGRG